MKRIKSYILLALLTFCSSNAVHALGYEKYVSFKNDNSDFSIVSNNQAVPFVIANTDFPGVLRVVGELATDIQRVTSVKPEQLSENQKLPSKIILIGTIGKNKLIDELISIGKIDPTNLKGKWETFKIQTIQNPFPGVESALVIVGSDKRGTIYGMYDVSEQIGVSPWNWWADVPAAKHSEIWVKNGVFTRGEPAVKYRGIFINDEAPAFSTWASKKFGGINSKCYVHVFDLILRLRGNYLWPAMWGSAFNMDDPLSPKLADEYGVVMGTSHHEPMIRSQQEWKKVGTGVWNYVKNKEGLYKFWEDGIARNKDFESIVTMGMRGDGDEPMTDTDDMDVNVKLLETIVADQRGILSKYHTQGVEKVPQVWALYKEVQDYYEHGMRVPDDVTLLWCDDNWGNLRRVPTAEERKRAGGAGIYYHFDYVGGPRSYKWINTNQTAKIWEQMSKAYDYGADRLWIVNVGDIKPMEYPIEFFLDLAWNPKRWGKDQIAEHCRLWSEREFGAKYADAIAEIISKYTKYNSRIKPELLNYKTFNLINYNEADRVLADYKFIEKKADSINNALPAEYKDAFFQMVLHPTKASANLYELYNAVAKNKYFAALESPAANKWAEKARECFRIDSMLSVQYHTIANGKWNGMMTQTHIGYTTWSDPKTNIMPKVNIVNAKGKAIPGVIVEGKDPEKSYDEEAEKTLPLFSKYNANEQWLTIYNRGAKSFNYKVSTSDKWINVSSQKGTVIDAEKLVVSIDWKLVPNGNSVNGELLITAKGKKIPVRVRVFNPEKEIKGAFVESNGVVSIEAEHYTAKTTGGNVSWEKIPDLGRTLSAMAPFPTTAAIVENVLEYKIYFFKQGEFPVAVYISPTINFIAGKPMRLAVKIDNQNPQLLEVNTGSIKGGSADNRLWEESVRTNIRKLVAKVNVDKPGYHTLKILMVDPIVAVQKIVINTGGEKPSYLGPPESYFAK